MIKNILIFGTGNYYKRYRLWFQSVNILALLDNNPAKQNTMIDGHPVMSPEAGVKRHYDAIFILSFYDRGMRQQLIELGVHPECIFNFYDISEQLELGSIDVKPVCYNSDSVDETEGDVKESAVSMIAAEPSGKNVVLEKKKILLISHDLLLGGPALALYHFAVVLRSEYQVEIASRLDGPLRDTCQKDRIPVIIDRNLQVKSLSEIPWIHGYSLILCNTIEEYTLLRNRDLAVPTIWWLHDSAFFYEGIANYALQKLDRTNLNVCTVGKVPAKAIHDRLPDLQTRELLYGVEEPEGANKTDDAEIEEAMICDDDAMNFISVGFVEPRKGQDLLVSAIEMIYQDNPSCLKNVTFIFIGDQSSLFAADLIRKAQKIPAIRFIGKKTRRELDSIYRRATLLICPSREDPMPTVAAEAMSYGVPCLLSDATGTADYITDGENGFLFQSENVDSLKAKLKACIRRNDLNQVGKSARKVYEEVFSMKAMYANVHRVLQDSLRTNNKPE